MPRSHAATLLLPCLICYALFLPAAWAAEQNKPGAEARRNLMLEQAFGLKLDAMTQEEVARSEARYLRNLYKALIGEGFSEEEAFEIVVHHQSLLLDH